ncbi:UNKNOWN [Stylonychia lemnae]|uniref:Uncharacterized protein n=1 Tax=Stylonychia lemnae TaxID=5949 RepID=A0A078AEE2_STYLE|nr:UNKNOWN [Stylonychia lemnae]|eukprot:CDW79867.1 UNKNOWN [Stylonychia lemnae]
MFDWSVSIIPPSKWSKQDAKNIYQYFNVSSWLVIAPETYIYFDFVPCDESRLFGNKGFLEQLIFHTEKGYDTFCPNQDLPLMGETEFIDIYLGPCDQEYLNNRYPGTKCETNKTLIGNSIKNTKLKFISSNKYFDTEEFQQKPVKSNVEVKSFFINKSNLRLQTFTLQVNKAVDYRSKIHESLEINNYQYMQTSLDSQTIMDRDDYEDYIIVRIRMKNDFNVNERQVNNLVGLLSNTGGLLGILTFIVGVMISPLQEFFFIQSMLKRRYYIDRNSSEQKIDDHNLQESNESLEYKLKKHGPVSYLQLIKNIRNRIPFFYTNKELFYDSLKRLKCCRTKKPEYRYNLYKFGEQSINHALDISHLVKYLRDTKIMKKILLKKFQRKLIPYFLDNVITFCYHKKLQKDELRNQNNKLSETEIQLRLAARMIDLFAYSKDKDDQLNSVVINSLFNPNYDEDKNKSLKQKLFIGVIKRYVQKNFELLTENHLKSFEEQSSRETEIGIDFSKKELLSTTIVGRNNTQKQLSKILPLHPIMDEQLSSNRYVTFTQDRSLHSSQSIDKTFENDMRVESGFFHQNLIK